DRQRGPSDGPAQLDLGLAHEPEVDQLADEAGHRRLVEPGLLRDRRARPRTVPRDVPEHHAEVVPPDGTLVRGSAKRVVVHHGGTLTGCSRARESGFIEPPSWNAYDRAGLA